MFWQVQLSTGNESLGSETSKLLHQTGECVLSLLQLTETFNLKNPWYGILTKRGTPLSKFQIGFLVFMFLSICARFCSHTACSLLVILQGALRKQSFF